MARVALWGVWFNDGTDLSDYMQLDAPSGLSHPPSIPAQQQVLAGGRIRLAITGPLTHEWQVSANRVSKSQRDWLEAHVGRPLWVRDFLGYRVYGFYSTVPDAVTQGAPRFNVSLSIAELTPPSV